MAQPSRANAGPPTARNRASVTGMLLAALFSLLGVLGLQGVPSEVSPGTVAPVAVAVRHSPQAAPDNSPAATATAADARNSVDDTCATTCGQPPRAGRAAPGEWHAPSPGVASVPAGFALPLPVPGPPPAASPGAFTPPQHSARYSGRGPPPPTAL